jgi:hypothetical protein
MNLVTPKAVAQHKLLLQVGLSKTQVRLNLGNSVTTLNAMMVMNFFTPKAAAQHKLLVQQT